MSRSHVALSLAAILTSALPALGHGGGGHGGGHGGGYGGHHGYGYGGGHGYGGGFHGFGYGGYGYRGFGYGGFGYGGLGYGGFGLGGYGLGGLGYGGLGYGGFGLGGYGLGGLGYGGLGYGGFGRGGYGLGGLGYGGMGYGGMGYGGMGYGGMGYGGMGYGGMGYGGMGYGGMGYGGFSSGCGCCILSPAVPAGSPPASGGTGGTPAKSNGAPPPVPDSLSLNLRYVDYYARTGGSARSSGTAAVVSGPRSRYVDYYARNPARRRLPLTSAKSSTARWRHRRQQGARPRPPARGCRAVGQRPAHDADGRRTRFRFPGADRGQDLYLPGQGAGCKTDARSSRRNRSRSAPTTRRLSPSDLCPPQRTDVPVLLPSAEGLGNETNSPRPQAAHATLDGNRVTERLRSIHRRGMIPWGRTCVPAWPTPARGRKATAEIAT